VLHLLLLSMSAHITKQLGMAPGGEFRTAFSEVCSIIMLCVSLVHLLVYVTCRLRFGNVNFFI